jgi:hypothetical protein
VFDGKRQWRSQNEDRPEHRDVEDVEQRHAEGDECAPDKRKPAAKSGVTRCCAPMSSLRPNEFAAKGASITKTSPRAFCAGRGEIRHSHWWVKHLPEKEHEARGEELWRKGIKTTVELRFDRQVLKSVKQQH